MHSNQLETSMKLTTGNRDVVLPSNRLPEELDIWINTEYPPSTQNNSRQYMRRVFGRLVRKGKVGVHVIQQITGIDFDYIPGQDDGEPPAQNNHETVQP